MKTIARRITHSFIFLSCLLVPSKSYSDSETYKPPIISDVPTIEHSDGSLRLSDRSVDFSISYQERGYVINNDLYLSHNPEYLKLNIIDSWTLLKQFLVLNRIPTSDCRSNYNINIFILEPDILYDTERFDGYFLNITGKSAGVYGFYDSTPAVERNSAIMLTNINATKNKSVLAHELAHYWFDRLCVATHWSKGSENFALSFEAYYKERR